MPVPAELPLVVHVGGQFYFKGESEGRVWLSPHDETPTPPCDAAPEELDVALAIDRFEHVVDWRIQRIEHKWAGLRSFAPDGEIVIGFDADCPGLFWLAGQGGYGIQSAAGASALAACLIKGGPLPAELTRHGVAPAAVAPARLRAVKCRPASAGRSGPAGAAGDPGR